MIIVMPLTRELELRRPTFYMSGWPKGSPLDERVCAQHGRELMGWKSPVGVPTWTRHESKDNHEPKARARPRGLVWRKPECKRCETTNRNRIVKAEGCKGREHGVRSCFSPKVPPRSPTCLVPFESSSPARSTTSLHEVIVAANLSGRR